MSYRAELGIVWKDGKLIAATPDGDNKMAELIAKAMNCHVELVAALKHTSPGDPDYVLIMETLAKAEGK